MSDNVDSGKDPALLAQLVETRHRFREQSAALERAVAAAAAAFAKVESGEWPLTEFRQADIRFRDTIKAYQSSTIAYMMACSAVLAMRRGG